MVSNIQDTEQVFNIIGIDPGNNTGIAIYTLNDKLEIVNVSTHTIKLSDVVSHEEYTLLTRVAYLSSVVEHLSVTYNPLAVVLESAFLNMRFPKAVIQLSQYTAALEQGFYKNNSFIKILRYPPKYIKKHIGATGKADKDDMLTAVSNIPEISRYLTTGITEHAVDAMAIGYVGIDYFRSYPHKLYTY